nr:single-stranded DNA-binding protein [uncultured Shinella sp.]
MRSVNRHTILGYVGNVITLNGVLKVNVASNREWQSDGERKSATDWVQVTVLDKKQAEWIEENVGQGDLVYIESRSSNSSYQREGEQVYVTDVIAQLFNLVSKSREHGQT